MSAAASRPGCVGVLVVLDGDGDPVCNLGPELLTRAQAVTGKPVRVAVADKCFESWIVSSAETLELGLTYPFQGGSSALIAEALRPAKYVKPVRQPRLVHRMDLDLATVRNASLRRMFERFDDLSQLLV